MMNSDVMMGICSPKQRKMDYYFKNADGDELIYIHDGEGVMYSQFGRLEVHKGDYLVIPRTTIYRFEKKRKEITSSRSKNRGCFISILMHIARWILLVGMGTYILMHFLFMILSRLPEGFTSHRLFIRHSKPGDL